MILGWTNLKKRPSRDPNAWAPATGCLGDKNDQNWMFHTTDWLSMCHIQSNKSTIVGWCQTCSNKLPTGLFHWNGFEASPRNDSKSSAKVCQSSSIFKQYASHFGNPKLPRSYKKARAATWATTTTKRHSLQALIEVISKGQSSKIGPNHLPQRIFIIPKNEGWWKKPPNNLHLPTPRNVTPLEMKQQGPWPWP